MSKSPIDETLLATWQRHNSSMGVYQRITRLSKQASSLKLGMSPNHVVKNSRVSVNSRCLSQFRTHTHPSDEPTQKGDHT
jgi:hypothetical protein